MSSLSHSLARATHRVRSTARTTNGDWSMCRTAAVPILAAALLISLPVDCKGSTKPAIVPEGGCDTPAAVTTVAGSGLKPEEGVKVYDKNLRTKWVAKGKGESLWLELAAPTVIDSVAIAFRKGHKRSHTFGIYLVTKDSQAKLVFEGESSGETKQFQTFSLGENAQEAEAVTIVGYGNSKNKWNGYAEVELCTHEAPAEAPEVEFRMSDTETDDEATIEFTELPFPADRKGFNVVNQCSFPVRVGSTGNQATCGEGTAKNPANGLCFWALPEGQRDLRPGEVGHYVLPNLSLDVGTVAWAGNIWASTGCTSDISRDYNFPATTMCVTNYCPEDGVCPDYRGPTGATTKAEFAMTESGLDFYDISLIDGSNIPMEIVPIDPVFSANDHFCGTPGNTAAFGELEGCQWKFSPGNVERFDGVDLSPYTRVVWPADPDNPVACVEDSDCQDPDSEDASYGFCGIYEERSNGGSSTTGSAVPGVCGRPVGWIAGHSACGLKTKTGETFPAGFPYNCDEPASHGTTKQLIRCGGSIYNKEACYLADAGETCCGCPPWDIKNRGCVSSNPEWTMSALPWASFFKSACPTAYSFPRDDRTSMFVCSNGETGVTSNTQSYSIRLCPGNSEESFFS